MCKKIWTAVYSFPDDFIPEIWAQESLMILENNLVLGNLIHRDFSDQVAAFGDVVNTRRPGNFTAARRVDGDSNTFATPSSTNVPITLDQWWHVPFQIRDGEGAKSFKNLVETYLEPAVKSIAQGVDQALALHVYQFLGNNAGRLGQAATISSLLDSKEKLDTNKCPLDGRFAILTPRTEADLLAIEAFTTAEKLADGGNTMRNGLIGRRFGIDFYMSQNMPSIRTGSTKFTSTISNSGGHAAGTTTLTLANISTNLPVPGNWCTIAGDDTPQLITGYNASTEALTISPGLVRDVANGAVVTYWEAGSVNLSAGYAAGWSKPIVAANFVTAPKSGQMITFGDGSAGFDSTPRYGLVGTPTTTSLLLDRPLTATQANTTIINLGPEGDYNFVGHKNAFGFITRPLSAAPNDGGVRSAVVNYNGLGIRVTMQYDIDTSAMKVVLDLLAGVATFDTNLGCAYFT